MKLCIDCKYMNAFKMECKHPRSYIEQHQVTGRKRYVSCIMMRNQELKCGQEAKLFEPSNPIIRIIRRIFV